MALASVLPQDPHHMPNRDSWQNLAIIIGIVTGFSVIAACTGFLTACCCRRKRVRKEMRQVRNESNNSDDTGSSGTHWSTAGTDVELGGSDILQDRAGRRQEDLLANDVFKGRELRAYIQEKRERKRRFDQRSSVHLPVHVRHITHKMQQLVRSLGFSEPITDEHVEPVFMEKQARSTPECAVTQFNMHSNGPQSSTSILGSLPKVALHLRPFTEPNDMMPTNPKHIRFQTE